MNDEEIYFRWGVMAIASEDGEGVHGSVNISKNKGLDSVGISEYTKHHDKPFFTIHRR